ncbi:DUF84 family protein [Jeotgalibacillus marinus]|uniref:inosine/xanthosine triphosphatase n=1 Tax=Jeotgalibacillus marinus TaxID=86667 RepID=A0ABV3Q0U6_9BACL
MVDQLMIAVGTLNKAKLRAVEQALTQLSYSHVNVIGVSVPSDVSEQPIGDNETITGAINRSMAAKKEIGASIGIGLEGGVVETPHGLIVCNWGALTDDTNDQPLIAGGARFRLPDEIAERIRAGQELGPVMESFSQKTDNHMHEGAVGFFTNGRINRASMFGHIVELLIGQWEYRNK